MSGGGSQPTQTTQTTVQMSPEQRELYNLAIPGVKSFAATVPERYGGSQIAGFDPAQVAGQETALGTAPQQAQLSGQAAQFSNNLLQGSLFDPGANPWLGGAIDASVRPITEAYQHNVLPGIRDEFQGSGQGFGGSRRGIADRFAATDYMRTVGDTANKLVTQNYGTNVDAMVKALGLAPQTTQNLLSPATTTSAVGDVRQNLAQQLLSQDVSNFNYDQLAPFLQSQDIISLIQGIPGGSSTATSTGNVPQQNVGSRALGGAATGAALGSALFPGVGTAAGAGLGGLLAFL
jgi:hypothetical protein